MRTVTVQSLHALAIVQSLNSRSHYTDCRVTIPLTHTLTMYSHCIQSLCTVTASSHCIQSLHTVTAYSHCIQSLHTVTVHSHCTVTAYSHCIESLYTVTIYSHRLLLTAYSRYTVTVKSLCSRCAVAESIHTPRLQQLQPAAAHLKRALLLSQLLAPVCFDCRSPLPFGFHTSVGYSLGHCRLIYTFL